MERSRKLVRKKSKCEIFVSGKILTTFFDRLSEMRKRQGEGG